MKTYKKKLPEGVKKAFGYEKGRKIRIINSDYIKAKKKNKKEN